MNEDLNGIEKNPKVKFPGQETGEKVNLFFRRHPLSFFGFSLLGITMVVLPIIIFITVVNSGLVIFESPLEPKIAVAIISAYVLFVLGMMLVAWMNYYLDVYIITDRRLIDIHQEGLFNRSLSAVDLVDVEDVNAQVRGLLPTYFDFGDVDVQTAGETQNVNFVSVPKPYLLARKVMDYHEKAVREEREEILEDVEEKQESKREAELEKLNAMEREERKRLRESNKEDLDQQANKEKNKEQPSDYESMEVTQEPTDEKENKSEEKKSDSGVVNKNGLEKGGKVDLD